MARFYGFLIIEQLQPALCSLFRHFDHIWVAREALALPVSHVEPIYG